jgi:hypothetical protein
MPVALSITPIGLKEAEKILNAANRSFPKVARDAILRSLKHGRTVADRSIRERYAIKQGDVLKQIKVEMEGNLEGTLESKGPMLPVSMFSPKQRKKRGSPVTVEILKGRRKELQGPRFMKGAKVMERRQAERYPIFPVSTAGIPLMTSAPEVSKKILSSMQKYAAARLEANVQRALEGKAFSI